MSHFAVLVIGHNPEKLLSGYDLNLELPMHLVFTKQQLIENERKHIEEYKNGHYADYLKDKEAYKAKHIGSPGHLDYIENIFPKRLEWTDDECYEYAIKGYRENTSLGGGGYWIDEDGGLWQTYNENGKWNWYQLGGRFRGCLKLKNGATPIKEQVNSEAKENTCSQAYKKDIANWLDKDFCFFAVLKGYKYTDREDLGLIDDDEGWKKEFDKLLANVPDDEVISIFDCHI